MNEKKCVRDMLWHGAVGSQALGKAAKFFGVGLNPMFAVAERLTLFGQLARVGVHGGTVEGPMGFIATVSFLDRVVGVSGTEQWVTCALTVAWGSKGGRRCRDRRTWCTGRVLVDRHHGAGGEDERWRCVW